MYFEVYYIIEGKSCCDKIDRHCVVPGTWEGSMFKNAVIGADNLNCFVAHVCTKFDSLEPSVIQRRDGKAGELGEPVKSEDQASAVGVKKLSSGNHK